MARTVWLQAQPGAHGVKRYRELLRDEITQTLSDPAHVDEEMRALFGAFAG